METSKLRARDASPPVTLAAGPVYVGEDDGLEEEFELDVIDVTELPAEAGPAFELPEPEPELGIDGIAELPADATPAFELPDAGAGATEPAADDGVMTGTTGAAEVTAATEGVIDSVTVVVVTGAWTKPPERGATAYGGSNRPNPPQALHGDAQALTGSGATRIGLQRLLGPWASMTVAGSVWGQSVPRSFSVSWRVAPGSVRMLVETSSRFSW